MESSECSVFKGTIPKPACHARGVSMSSALALCMAMSWPQNFSTRYRPRSSAVHATAAVKAAVLSDHQFRHPFYLGILFAEALGQTPVCCGAFAVQHAGSRSETHARADAGDGRSPLVPAPEPRDNRRIALDHVIQT